MSHLQIGVGPVRLLIEKRSMWVCVVLTLSCGVAGIVALTTGSYPISAAESMRALFGGSDDSLATYFVTSQRAPRALAALLVGACLGVSGAIMQQVSRNPLGSPDIIGFTVGAATGALVAILVAGAGPWGVSAGAAAGGMCTALVVWLLIGGTLTASRLILVGIGVSLVLQAVNTLLMVRAELNEAQSAAQWLAGSLNATTWTRTGILAAGFVVLGILAALLARGLTVLSLGDELAAGLGVSVSKQTTGLILVAVALASLATAIAGPVAFVALAAPQLARRLTRTAHSGLLAAALMGGALVMVSDLLAQRLFAPTQLAVGVVTGALGGLYLVALLAFEWRRQ